MVVKLVKHHLKAILLAIGDGANDVSMIQTAHIGVGISGAGGLQAARNADVVIGQFCYLRKLLLVHGAWNFQRTSKYSIQNAFSGQSLYESWNLSFYNLIFTVAPPFVMGIFDRFIFARHLDHYAGLYEIGQEGMFFQMHSFLLWIFNGIYHSLLLYFVSEFIWLWEPTQGDGRAAEHWVWGTALYTAVLVTVLGKAALVTDTWTKYTFLAIPGSMILWMIFIPLYATMESRLDPSEENIGVALRLFSSPAFCAKRIYYPRSYHHIQEIQKYNIQDYRPRMDQFRKIAQKVEKVQRMRKQRGYAFSQADEAQMNRILQAYDTTRERGKYGERTSGQRSAA
ncbi:MAG: hypothetical protein M1840_007577 [Geoglossum simile]|nr:MAG: hypothetical protein M1840_007577 [Geoglossum simile]